MVQKWKFSEVKETSRWKDIIENMYFPYDESLKLFMQQDGFLDKELIPVSEIDSQSLPINQNWSWDRILRSCYIKQADTLLSFFWFENDFTPDQHRNHFDFYESFTVHESSLSPCIHAILAARIGYEEKSYQMYLRTARLDLDDYNNDTGDGLHITSMGGTWMAFVMGFGGLRVQDNILKFNPFLPDKWGSYSFTLNFRGAAIHLRMEKGRFTAANMSGIEINLEVWGTRKLLSGNNSEIFTKM
jgi:maltose phosphorylase